MTIKFTGGIATTGQLTANPQFTLTPTDEFFDSVVLLLHADDHTDVKSHTVTNVDVTTNTSDKQFGTGSSEFNGTTAYYTIPDSDEWHLGSGDFTMEMWAWKDPAITTFPNFMSQWGSEFAFQFRIERDANEIAFHYTTTGAAGGQASRKVSQVLPSSTWFHIALSRNGADLRFFLDGVQAGATQDLTGVTIHNSPSPLAIGMAADGDDNPAAVTLWKGKLDDIRFTKGVGRYTANFTPPTAAFPDQ